MVLSGRETVFIMNLHMYEWIKANGSSCRRAGLCYLQVEIYMMGPFPGGLAGNCIDWNRLALLRRQFIK